LYDLAETEISPFGDFDSADLFYGFYPDVYPGMNSCDTWYTRFLAVTKLTVIKSSFLMHVRAYILLVMNANYCTNILILSKLQTFCFPFTI